MFKAFAAGYCALLTLSCLVAVLFILSANAQKPDAAPTKSESDHVKLEKQAVLASRRPYAAPPVISKRDSALKEVTASLVVKFGLNKIEDVVEGGRLATHQVRTRTYNGSLVGGTIHALPGDVLKIALTNSIPRCELDVPLCPNEPNGFNITNLHTHGLHVSPEGNSDNVFLEIGPEEHKPFCFDIPADHTPGTFWYHAHRHGSTALQLTSGMAGALLLGGGLDTVPEIAEAMKDGREKLLIFQQITYSLNAQNIGEVTREDVYGEAKRRQARLAEGKQFEATLINGVHHPVIKMKPGEVQRWRCVHAGIQKTIPLALVKVDDESEFLWLYELARDGLPLYRVEKCESLKLYPGYRSDFLVQAPLKPGQYYLKQPRLAAEEALNRLAQREEYLARVEVEKGPAVTMKLPDPYVVGKFALKPIDGDELVNRKPIPFVFKADEPTKEFSVNGDEFDHDRVDVAARLGTAEEWALSSTQDTHPFHIHVNPFEVVEKDQTGKIVNRYWRDTIAVLERHPPERPILIRMRFETFPGKTVLHCHNLVHEDRGMMTAVRLVGKPPLTRCTPTNPRGLANLPVKAPDWVLPDATNREHRLAGFTGRKVLLVFVRGLGCAHCRRQLAGLARHRSELDAAGLTVVAVCPETPEELGEQLREVVASVPKGFRLLSDSSLEAFRRYGCHDGQVLHGTFLLDGEGLVRWQQVGDEPFMDVEVLLRKGRELRPANRPGGG